MLPRTVNRDVSRSKRPYDPTCAIQSAYPFYYINAISLTLIGFSGSQLAKRPEVLCRMRSTYFRSALTMLVCCQVIAIVVRGQGMGHIHRWLYANAVNWCTIVVLWSLDHSHVARAVGPVPHSLLDHHVLPSETTTVCSYLRLPCSLLQPTYDLLNSDSHFYC